MFAAADSYDVPSLRALVVKKFTGIMQETWSTKNAEFCQAMQQLCGPIAPRCADTKPQEAFSSFCDSHFFELMRHQPFINMLQTEEPFAGRIIASIALANLGIVPGSEKKGLRTL